MKNITLSAVETLIEEARERGRGRNTTLNEEFRRWPSEYVDREDRVERAMRTIEELGKKIVTNGPYARDELNER
jgi:hypothetical protein